MSINAARLLRQRMDTVMQRWDDRVRQEIPAARDQDQVVLRNDLLSMLEVMAKILAGETDPKTAARDLDFITGHGGERAEIEAYTLEQMIEECQILQEVVFEEMEPEFQVSAHDRNVVVRYLGEVIRQAAGEFARVQTAKATAAAEAQRETDARYRTLFNSLDEGFCIIEVLFDDAGCPLDYRFVEVNPAFERQTGLQDAVGKRIREMVPGHEEHWYQTYGRIVRTGEPARFESRAEALGRWYDVYALRVGEPDDRRVAVLFTDILPRKRAEEARRMIEERQTFLLRLSDELRGLSDPVAVQEKALRVLGDRLGAARTAYAEDGGDDETAMVTRSYVYGVPDIEGRYRYADYGEGLLRELRAGRSVVRPDIANDPTLSEAEKAAHEALQLGATLNVPLVKGGCLVAMLAVHYPAAHAFSIEEVSLVEDVAERTWAAVERAKAEAALRAADRAKTEFLAMLGHELRNPLGAAANALHLIHLHVRNLPTLQRAVQVLERQMAQMTRLVEDLLDVTRITQGRVKLEMRPVLLDDVVTASLRNLQPAIHAKGLRYRYEGDPRAVVLGDALRLEQVVTNLIGNSVKYTDAGTISVSVGAANHAATLSVRDTGIGIAPEALPYVFDLFSQAGADLARTQGGLGIGLTVVKQIVEQHGGRVRAQSDGAGRGSSFTVTLPLMAEPGLIRAAKDPGACENEPQRQALRVLVVDDNQDAAQTLADILETWGHEARTAHDGPEAVAAITESPPDVALIDIGLPGMDGYEVARAVRSRSGRGSLHLIALTGYSQAGDRARAMASGFDHHMAKPVDLQALARHLLAGPSRRP